MSLISSSSTCERGDNHQHDKNLPEANVQPYKRSSGSSATNLGASAKATRTRLRLEADEAAAKSPPVGLGDNTATLVGPKVTAGR